MRCIYCFTKNADSGIFVKGYREIEIYKRVKGMESNTKEIDLIFCYSIRIIAGFFLDMLL